MTTSTQLPSSASRWRQFLTVGFIILGLALICFFGLRLVRSHGHLQHGLRPGVTDVELVRGWMTVPYVARAYDVPEAYIFEHIGIPQQGNESKSLFDLNREYAPGQHGVIINRVKEALQRYPAKYLTSHGRPDHD